jgi:hypothetical protein
MPGQSAIDLRKALPCFGIPAQKEITEKKSCKELAELGLSLTFSSPSPEFLQT